MYNAVFVWSNLYHIIEQNAILLVLQRDFGDMGDIGRVATYGDYRDPSPPELVSLLFCL